MTWDQLVTFPRCGHARTTQNMTPQGKCRECARVYSLRYHKELRAQYGMPQPKAEAARAAARDIARLGVSGIHGDQFDRARRRTENRLARSRRT